MPKICPPLYLAPMEGLGDLFFRKAIACIGGFDEACTEFIRVPSNAHIRSLSKKYQSDEILPFPLAAQIMGQDAALMGEMTNTLIERGAPRIDLNCGCPSNVVVGRGAGSSLLKSPDLLFEIVNSMTKAANGRVPVSVKMRSGYDDTSLLKENLNAAEKGGAAFITLHHRTRKERYMPPIYWNRIKEAKEILHIPLIGSGDINTAQDAKKMLDETKCDGLMVGRAAVRNPLIFHEIRAHFHGEEYVREWDQIKLYFQRFKDELEMANLRDKTIINKFKQLIANYFIAFPEAIDSKKELLRQQPSSVNSFFNSFCNLAKGLELKSQK